LLPKPNIDLLSVLVRFFVEVSSHSSLAPEGDSGNKMNLDNMATVIAPNILYTKAAVPENSTAVIEIIRLIFTCHQSLFKVVDFLILDTFRDIRRADVEPR
jgi:RhoGAP domain